MSRSVLSSLCVLVLGTVLAAPARGDLVTYTFDGPQFLLGQRTPLLDRAPNIGAADFRTSFTSGPTGNGFFVDVFQPNPLFSGQMIYDPEFVPDILTLTFNMLVDYVRLDFAVVEPRGRLVLTSPVGGLSQNSMFVGGDFEGGTLEFRSDTPFTTLQLQAFNEFGNATLFAMDNLSLNTSVVPEPSTVILLLVGLGSYGGFLMARRRGAVGPRSEASRPI